MGIVAAAAVASAAISAAGAIQQANATSSADRYNASIAANNASIAKQNANYAGAEGEQQTEQAGIGNREKLGNLKANQGASGIESNTGSSANVQASESMIAQEDVMNTRANAARRAYGFETQAAGDTAQSDLDKSQAGNAKTAGYINAGTTALGAAAKLGASGAFGGSSGGGDAWSAQTNGSALNSSSFSQMANSFQVPEQ